jgi:hypothetical protein
LAPPNPEKGESLQGFVSRYMGSKEGEKSFPKQSQRAAVAYSEYRRKRKNARH